MRYGLSLIQQNRLKKIAASASVGVAFILLLIKTFGVWYTGSLTVFSSLIDSMSDLFASIVTCWAIKVSTKPADSKHRYGHGKAEALSALLQAAFIFGSGLFVIYDGFYRLFYPQEIRQIDFGIAIMLTCMGLTILLIVFQNYVAKRTNSRAIRADAMHYSVDIITNMMVVVALVITGKWQIWWFDILGALVIALYLLRGGFRLAQDAVSVLMDKELSDDMREEIIKLALECSQICGVHDLRTHDLGGKYLFEMHLELDSDLPLAEAHKYTKQVEIALQSRFPNTEIVIHQDPIKKTH